MRAPLHWFVAWIGSRVDERIDDRLEGLAYAYEAARESIKSSELYIINNLGRIMAENDSRNRRDAQCLAHAMVEEKEEKMKLVDLSTAYVTAYDEAAIKAGLGAGWLGAAGRAAKKRKK